MWDDMKEIAQEVAKNSFLDGYTAWRMLKNIDNEIYWLKRTKTPVPFELICLRRLVENKSSSSGGFGNSVPSLSDRKSTP